MSEVMYKIRTGDYLQFILKLNDMEMNFKDYDCFIAECYEAEDEFWEDVFNDMEADYWIDEAKNL